jgi:cell division protein FtsB
MSETKVNEKKVVGRNVAIALGIICILLIAVMAYFSVTGISAQNSYSNLQNQNSQLQTWLNGNETLLSQTQYNNTNLQNQVNDLIDNLNLNKSSICIYNNSEHSLPVTFTSSFVIGDYDLFLNSADETNIGIAIVHISSSYDTYVTTTFSSHGYDFINERHVGMNGTAAFAILPSYSGIFITVDTHETNTGATANVTITYYY